MSDIQEMRFEDSERDRYTATKGDVLICEGGYPGRAAIWPHNEPIYLQKAIHRVRFHNPEHAKWFLYFLLLCDMDGSLKDHFTGTGIQHFTGEALKRFRVPFPPLSDQIRMVAILDEAFDGIAAAVANTERNLANARELFDNCVCTTFCLNGDGWVKTTLGALCDSVEYGTATKSLPVGRVPVLRMGNIQNGDLDWDNLAYTDDSDEIEKYALQTGDVLFNRTNSAEHVGKAAIYRGEQPAIFAGYLIRIHRKEECLDGEFLNHFLNSPIARDYGKSVMSQSVNQANISGSKLKEYPIAIPSIDKQREIAARLRLLKACTSDLEVIYQRKLEELQNLKQSILERAFAGELAVEPERLLQEAVA